MTHSHAVNWLAYEADVRRERKSTDESNCREGVDKYELVT